MVVVLLNKPQPTIAALLRPLLIQVDVDLGMAQSTATAIAGDLAAVHGLGRNAGNQVNGKARVHLLEPSNKADVAHIIISPALASVCHAVHGC